jgi:hypothetical protein
MRIKDETIKEIEALKPDELLMLYDLILSLKSKISKEKVKKILPAYIRVREALKGCEGCLSEDVLLTREERI